MMTAVKRFFAFLMLVAVASCIDPFTPNLKNYKTLLVVDGLLTNENSSYKIKLTRTFPQENSDPEKVTDANVTIIDGNGTEINLQNAGNGYYKTDSTSFVGVIGQKYTLQIMTGDGEEYRSEECTMMPVAGIENVRYEKGEEITGVESQPTSGLKILLNSEDASGMNQYFRWTYEESWKFLLPNPPQYICLMVLDPDTYLFKPVPEIKKTCWRNNLSGEIITSTIQSGETNFIRDQLIQFIDPVNSDRLTQQYSILVKQYSISEKEYSFWNNLKKVGKAGADLFASQPYQVISNIHNVSNSREMVLGYFGVSSVSKKRIFITASELDPLNLPHFEVTCKEIPKSPDDWPSAPPGSPPSFYEIYYKYMNKEDYVFIRPEFNWDNTLARLVYARRACSLCDYAGGGSNKPDFWIDMK
jgi:hypothetical protein